MLSAGLSKMLMVKYVSMILAGGEIGHRFLDGIGNGGGYIDSYVGVEGEYCTLCMSN